MVVKGEIPPFLIKGGPPSPSQVPLQQVPSVRLLEAGVRVPSGVSAGARVRVSVCASASVCNCQCKCRYTGCSSIYRRRTIRRCRRQ